MTDYNKPLDGLVADCLKSVQRYFFSSQESQAIAATPAAYTPRKAMPASIAPRPSVPEILPFPAMTPRSDSPQNLPSSTAIDPYSGVNRNVPSAATAPRSALSTNLSPAATAASPFVPLFHCLSVLQSPPVLRRPSMELQLRLTRQSGTTNSQGLRQRAQGRKSRKRYRNMCTSAMKTELKSRGLSLSSGHNADFVKRLEKDDGFQAEPRTDDDYDTMNPKAIYSLCVRRSIPSRGEVSSLRERLKGHDKRENATGVAVAGVGPLLFPSGPLSALKFNADREMLAEEPSLQTVKDEPALLTGVGKECEETAETVPLARPVDFVKPRSTSSMLLGQSRSKSGNEGWRRKRRCMHDRNGNEDSPRATQPIVPNSTGCKSFIEDSTGVTIGNPALAVEEVVGTRVTRFGVSHPKASASRAELRRPAGIERVKKHENTKDNVPVSRRRRLFYLPEDEITLLQICVNLKSVIAWGNIHGFWNMVQDTLQMETGKPYGNISRHINTLVRKRRAEQQEIERRGTISMPRVSAGCRPLLDEWIAGGNQVDHASPSISTTSTMIEDQDDLSFGKEGKQQLDSDGSALETQRRAATDTWLDTSCETLRSKKVKHCTPEPTSITSKSRADSLGCWSLSGTSVTSESSFEDESEDEDEDEDNVKGGN